MWWLALASALLLAVCAYFLYAVFVRPYARFFAAIWAFPFFALLAFGSALIYSYDDAVTNNVVWLRIATYVMILACLTVCALNVLPVAPKNWKAVGVYRMLIAAVIVFVVSAIVFGADNLIPLAVAIAALLAPLHWVALQDSGAGSLYMTGAARVWSLGFYLPILATLLQPLCCGNPPLLFALLCAQLATGLAFTYAVLLAAARFRRPKPPRATVA